MRSKGACSGSPNEPSAASAVMLVRSSRSKTPRLVHQPPVTLDRVDAAREPAQDRRLVARAGADLEHLVAGPTSSASVISATTEGWLIVWPQAMGSGMSS
jgi:hypothetical protein